MTLKSEIVPQEDDHIEVLTQSVNYPSDSPDSESESDHGNLTRISLRTLEELAPPPHSTLIPNGKPTTISGHKFDINSIEEDWRMLGRVISKYSMNHHWLRNYRFGMSRVRIRKPGHQCETPTKYILRILELLNLIYGYFNSEVF